MSGLFGSIKIEANRLTEFSDQTGSVGLPIPFGYGVVVVDGNLIWVDKVVTHTHKKKKRALGITVAKTVTYSYTRSYAIAFMQGPTYGYLSIYRNGKIVYTADPRASIEDRAFAQVWVRKASLYSGTRTQTPNATIEAVRGIGQVSAHRDLAYIVVRDDDVTDTAGAVPSYQAIIVASPPRVFMTSWPYALESEDGVDSSADGRGGYLLEYVRDAVDSALEPLGGAFYGGLISYSNGVPDAVDTALEPLGGTLS